jgi:hypothetical protein
MTGHVLLRTLPWLLIASLASAQPQSVTTDANRVVLGPLSNGAAVAFIRASSGDWGIEISGGAVPRLTQRKPAQIEVFAGGENARQLAAGYQSVQKETDAVVAKAKVAGGGQAAFAVEDRWTVSGTVLSLSRKVSVADAEDNAGFYSAIRLSTASTVQWEDANYFAPDVLYADPSHDGDNSPGGTANYRAKRFTIREDQMSAPLFALLLRDGNWAAVLDLAPRGDTTLAETTAPASTPVIDERIQFGALGARGMPEGGVEFGFWLPGTTIESGGGFGIRGGATATPVVRRRYHPVKVGFSQSYQVGFRFGQGASFRDMERDTWRWAWETLKPKVTPVDVEVVRRTLIDHLEARVITVDGRTGVPFLYDAVTGKPGSYRRGPTGRRGGPGAAARQGGPARPANMPLPRSELSPEDSKALAQWARGLGVDLDPNARELARWPRIIMGFVSKGIESADQLLREGDRDPSPRGQKMREHGLAIIDTFIRLVPMSPPTGEGFNLWTGKPDTGEGVFGLRAPSEDMRTLVDAYRRERKAGREHPEWLRWCVQLADWMLTQQRQDGSFPRSWVPGTGEVKEESGTSSYNPVPLLIRLSQETGQKRYLDSTIRAAEYVWANYGSRGVFVGGATDNPNIVDKEAGMLSMEAFLDLYDATGESKWLERAQAAGNYTESWIWIWNVPMPPDANDAELQWKRGVPTVGAQGISALYAGSVDEYLDWAVPAYARLYKHTKDEHYLDVARILLHDTKAMLALPGRTYDLLGPGWQQENWRMGPNTRSFGSHRSWLPWVSVNHLHGITGLEELDPALYQQLAKGN